MERIVLQNQLVIMLALKAQATDRDIINQLAEQIMFTKARIKALS